MQAEGKLTTSAPALTRTKRYSHMAQAKRVHSTPRRTAPKVQRQPTKKTIKVIDEERAVLYSALENPVCECARMADIAMDAHLAEKAYATFAVNKLCEMFWRSERCITAETLAQSWKGADAMQENPTLILPRRNFLVRALGFTAAGATMPISIITASDALARIDHHEAALKQAWNDYYGRADVVVDRSPLGTIEPASVRSDGRRFAPHYKTSSFFICASGRGGLPALDPQTVGGR
jgi:hypothetical protein